MAAIELKQQCVYNFTSNSGALNFSLSLSLSVVTLSYILFNTFKAVSKPTTSWVLK